MKYIVAFILRVRLKNCPRGMPIWKFLWRCFAIKFYWHKTVVVRQHCRDESWVVRCDDYETGCLNGCRRLRKLAEWEEKDKELAQPLPEARIHDARRVRRSS